MKQEKRADLMKMFQNEPNEFECSSVPVAFNHTFRLNKVFEDISQFDSLVDTLENASCDDVIMIRLASPGGSMEAIMPVLAAMDNTDAFIHCHVDSSIASAASFIMLKGHAITFNPLADVMLHHVSYYTGGHGGNVEAQVNHTTRVYKRLIEDTYKILSPSKSKNVYSVDLNFILLLVSVLNVFKHDKRRTNIVMWKTFPTTPTKCLVKKLSSL